MSEEPVQPEINLGIVGHVDHGKTTLTERLSGKWTDTHSEEMKRGITIRLGYADMEVRKCEGCDQLTTDKECPECGEESDLVRKASIVDAPGHESLMATMISGSTIIDGALLLISAAEDCPQPQTREHLTALQIAGIENLIVVQNKIDLVGKEEAVENHQQIKEFLEGTEYEDAPVIPISARNGVNVEVLLEAIEDFIPTPEREEDADSFMLVARSFDVNKPGTEVEDIVGGILGGALKKGTLSKGDEIEIKPGRSVEEHNKEVWKPITAKVEGLESGGDDFEELGPGGSAGVRTSLDPSVTKSDALSGSVAGEPGTLPEVLQEVKIEPKLLDHVVGTEEEKEVKPLARGEPLMLNVNAGTTVGSVVQVEKGEAIVKLKKPICANVGDKVTISRRIGSRFRLIGYGKILEE